MQFGVCKAGIGYTVLLKYHRETFGYICIDSLWSLSLDSQHHPVPSTGQNKQYGNIIFYETSVFTVNMANNDVNHRCLAEKNVFF